MWGPKYCPGQYNEGRKSVPVVLRRSYGPATNDSNAYRSTYGVWNDSYGIRCGLWDDVLYQHSRTYQHESKRRRNVSEPISKVSTRSQHVRYEALALPKTTGFGPNCKKSRCAATDPPYHYAKPHCTADKRRTKTRRAKSESSPSVKKYTYNTMALVQDTVLDRGGCDIRMGLKDIMKVEGPEEAEDLLTCERKCGECSETPLKSKEEEVEMRRDGTQGSGLNSLARTRAVGSNTEVSRAAAEIPVRVLQDVSINTVLHYSEKMAPPVVSRLKIPTPIPRVAFLRPPKPSLKDILEYEGDKFPTPRLPTPRTPRPTWSSSPVSLTSRSVSPSRIPPQMQIMMPGKLVPRLFTPPTTIRLSRTGSMSPRSPIPPKMERTEDKSQPNPPLQQVSPTLQPLTLTPQESSKLSSKQTSKPSSKESSSKQSSEQSSKESSKQTSKSDSLVNSISDFENSSRSTGSLNNESIAGGLTPRVCLCSLCGKCESINDGSQDNSATIYRNNPLYGPGRALATTNSNTGPSRWRFLYTSLEVMFLVVLAAVLTVGMIPYVETVFRAYMADYCSCSAKGKANGGPQVTADGMQSGVVKWINCMMDDSRSTLTPAR